MVVGALVLVCKTVMALVVAGPSVAQSSPDCCASAMVSSEASELRIAWIGLWVWVERRSSTTGAVGAAGGTTVGVLADGGTSAVTEASRDTCPFTSASLGVSDVAGRVL